MSESANESAVSESANESASNRALASRAVTIVLELLCSLLLHTRIFAFDYTSSSFTFFYVFVYTADALILTSHFD